MASIYEILMMLLGVVKTVILIHFIMSWLISFGVLNLHQPIVAQIWYGLNKLLEPVYSRIRAFLPNLGNLDLAPLVALVALMAIRIVLNDALRSAVY